jgi:hypothetical protein
MRSVSRRSYGRVSPYQERSGQQQRQRWRLSHLNLGDVSSEQWDAITFSKPARIEPWSVRHSTSMTPEALIRRGDGFWPLCVCLKALIASRSGRVITDCPAVPHAGFRNLDGLCRLSPHELSRRPLNIDTAAAIGEFRDMLRRRKVRDIELMVHVQVLRQLHILPRRTEPLDIRPTSRQRRDVIS